MKLVTNWRDVPLSSLFKNPFVASAFGRAERDDGMAPAIPSPKSPVLIGGAAVVEEG